MTKLAFWIGVFLCLLNDSLVRAQDKLTDNPIRTLPLLPINQKAPAVPRMDLQSTPINDELSLTLRDAIELALERNPSFEIEKIRLERAREKINEEMGDYDSLINFRSFAGRRDNIVASRFYPTGLYVDTEHGQSVGYESKTR